MAATFVKDRDKMCNHYRGPSIDASYQVSVHLAKGLQRRRIKCEKLNEGRHVMANKKMLFKNQTRQEFSLLYTITGYIYPETITKDEFLDNNFDDQHLSCVARSSVFCVEFCRSLFVLSLLAITKYIVCPTIYTFD